MSSVTAPGCRCAALTRRNVARASTRALQYRSAIMDASTLDEALVRLAPYGPDLSNGLTNHAPMAVEALCAMKRPDAVSRWLDRYSALLVPRGAPRERIAPGVVGARARSARAFSGMGGVLRGAASRGALARRGVALSARLMPAVCASAIPAWRASHRPRREKPRAVRITAATARACRRARLLGVVPSDAADLSRQG